MLTSAGSATTLRCGLLLSEHLPRTFPGKNDNLYLAAASSTVRDSNSIGLLLVVQGHPSLSSLILRFLFVCPKLCPAVNLSTSAIRLPSDSTSQWIPLPLANGSCYRVRSRLSPPSYRPCRAHTITAESRFQDSAVLASGGNDRKRTTTSTLAIRRKCSIIIRPK